MLLAISCKQPVKQAPKLVDGKTYFWQLLAKGDSVYAIKSSLENFRQALVYYDSAYAIADTSTDLLLKANVNISIGRVYDAWKDYPDKTIYYYSRGTDYYRTLKIRQPVLFCSYLVIHAMAEKGDSAAVIQQTQALLLDLANDKHVAYNNLKTVLAYECTIIKNYLFAQAILQQIKNGSNIKNNNLNYKDKWIITNALVEQHTAHTFKWKNNMVALFDSATNTVDSFVYADILYHYCQQQNDFETALKYSELAKKLDSKLRTEKLQKNLTNQLYESQLSEEKLKEKAMLLKHENNKHVVGLLAVFVLFGILFIVILLRRKNKIEDQNKTLEQLNTSLNEKINQNELLTKEVHHRVKNNLYLVYSLLRMQEKKLDNEESIHHLQAARLRIESIAMMHEQLMAHHNQIHIKDYITQLIDTTAANITHHQSLISNLQIDEIDLPADICFPIALILNEWITNTLKYATTGDNSLHIYLSMKKTNNGVEIIYYDSGDANKSEKIIEGLGTRIIQLLVQQLNATLNSYQQKQFGYQLILPDAN
jgi:two-component sensor histidine kinase